MEIAVISFPGSNCDRDVAKAVEAIAGRQARRIWHKDSSIGKPDLVIIPGGFSFGDYLRCGAMAAHCPAMEAVYDYSLKGGMVLGICNGFQILTESGLLPGVLMRNASLKFTCRMVQLKTHQQGKAIMGRLEDGEALSLPVAHNEGQFFADAETLARLHGNGQIAFTYNKNTNPNGSVGDIAGVTSANGRILGLMPHPERMMGDSITGGDAGGDLCGGSDGRRILTAIIEASQL